MSVKERITVTVDADLAAQVKQLSGSTSSFVETAIREKLDRQRHARAMLERDLEDARSADPAAFAEAEARVARMMAEHFGGTA